MTYSIIIPVYNAERYLSACLDSVLAQNTRSEYEVILVDDGSVDSSGKLCDAYAAQDGRFRVFHQENGGAGAARNKGIRAAKGCYILFLDADDLWEPNFLAALDDLVAERPDLVTFSGQRFTRQSGDGAEIHQMLCPSGESGQAWLNRLFCRQALPQAADWFYGYRRDFLEKHQLFFRTELRVSEDFDLIMRCLENAESITGTDRILYHYRYLPDSLSNKITLEKYLDDIGTKVQYFRKYPNAATADYYCSAAVNVVCLGCKKTARTAIRVLRDNQDIMRYAAYGPYRLAALLFRVFGYYRGSAVYMVLQDFWHKYGKTGAFAKRR